MKAPPIPMSPNLLPQQRVVAVINLPPRPDDIDVCLYRTYKHKLPKLPSRQAKHLCQVEWAWSPMHSRISNYFIHKGHSYWILWESIFDDDRGWYWHITASVPHKGCTEYQAAVHLLSASWHCELGDMDLDQFHWVNHHAFLSVADLAAIARTVWN